jgi:hypothetical protein
LGRDQRVLQNLLALVMLGEKRRQAPHFLRHFLVVRAQVLHLLRDGVEEHPHFRPVETAERALLELMTLDV